MPVSDAAKAFLGARMLVSDAAKAFLGARSGLANNTLRDKRSVLGQNANEKCEKHR